MILYFSGTGNSKYVANELAQKLGDSLFSINEGIKNGVAPQQANDNLVLVCPTYAWRIPKLVVDYVKNTDFVGAKRIWFVMTCGGEIGNAAKFNKELAEVKHLDYMGSFGIRLPDNYIIMFPAAPQDAAQKLFAEAPEKIEKLAAIISAGQAFPKPRSNMYDKAMSSLVNPLFYKNVKSDLFLATDACNGCGLCEKLCPLNNIKLAAGKPTWGHTNCTHCMSCISYCKQNAIEYGKKTVGKRRYTIESYR